MFHIIKNVNKTSHEISCHDYLRVAAYKVAFKS